MILPRGWFSSGRSAPYGLHPAFPRGETQFFRSAPVIDPGAAYIFKRFNAHSLK